MSAKLTSPASHFKEYWQETLNELTQFLDELDRQTNPGIQRTYPSRFNGYRFMVLDPQTKNHHLGSRSPKEWPDLLIRIMNDVNSAGPRDMFALCRMPARLEAIQSGFERMGKLDPSDANFPFTQAQIDKASKMAECLSELEKDLKPLIENCIDHIRATKPSAFEEQHRRALKIANRKERV